MKLLTKTLFACLVTGTMLISCDKNDDNDNELNAQDHTFLVQASLGNTAEVGAGMLASTKGDSSAIRAFGQMMSTDHTQAQTDLKATGTNVGVNVTDTIDATHAALLVTLNGLSGRAFDSVYIVNQITDHQTTIAAFQAELNSGSHSQVLNFANTYLPKIQMHLQKADSIATAMHFK